MRTLLVTIVVVAIASITQARVWTTVYRCDETTPLAAADPNHPSVYRDIMVGTRLAIVIKSDAGASWQGQLLSSVDDSRYFSLDGRGYSEKWFYEGSCLPAAGEYARAWDFDEVEVRGFLFKTSVLASAPGDWFILDYRAEQVGSCSLTLYDYDPTVAMNVPVETLFLTHVPSRDFDNNSTVDFEDFAVLASHWHTTVASDPNAVAIQYDLNSDGLVDIGDLILFSGYWLERTNCDEPVGDPNQPLNP